MRLPSKIIFSLILCLSNLLVACSQKQPDKLKELWLVDYRPDDPSKDTHITAVSIIHVLGNGKYSRKTNAFNAVDFTNYLGDTTCFLPDSSMALLNGFFLSGKALNSYTNTYNFYGGTYLGFDTYIYYTTLSGHKDSLIAIYPDMQDGLKKILSKIYRFPRLQKLHVEDVVYHDLSLENKILKYDTTRSHSIKIGSSPSLKKIK